MSVFKLGFSFYFKRMAMTSTHEPISVFTPGSIELIAKRLRERHRTEIKGASKAGVVIPLTINEQGKASILFTTRSKTVGTHKGEVSFPGGKLEPNDRDIVDCALREMYEEVGIPCGRVFVLGTMDDVLSFHNVSVTPVIGSIGQVNIAELRPNPDEIEDVFLVSLEDLTDPGKLYFIKDDWRGIYPVFIAAKKPIWGLTGYMCYQFCKEILQLDITPSSAKL